MPTVYKTDKSKFYQTDIWINGDKFSRSTKRTSEREANSRAAEIEKELRAELEAKGDSETSTLMDAVAGRYMLEIGDQHAGEGASITRGKVDRIVNYFGADRDFLSITHSDAIALKNWRAKQKWHGKPLSPFTINDTTEQLKKLFTFLKLRGVKFGKNAPNFKDPQLWMEEPEVRPRVLSDDEQERLRTIRSERAPRL